jgi:hypothetical protein
MPDHKVLDMVFAVVPGDEIAPDPEAQVEMLWQAWERIDEWIGARRDGADGLH